MDQYNRSSLINLVIKDMLPMSIFNVETVDISVDIITLLSDICM